MGIPGADSRRPAAGAGRMGNRSGALPGAGAEPRGSAGARRTRVVGNDGCRARSDCQPSPADPHITRGGGAALVRHRHRLRSRHRPGTRPEVPRAERHHAHLHARQHARAKRPALPGHLGRRGRALRTSRVAGARHRRLAPRGRRHDRVERAWSVRVCGRTPSPAICRSCSSASPGTTACRSCGRCCRPRSTGGSRD